LQTWVTRSEPVVAAERKRIVAEAKAAGEPVPPKHSDVHVVKMALQEFNHGDNANRLTLMDISEKVHKPMEEAEISPDQAGSYLLYMRIAEGDRGGMAEHAKEAIMDATGEDSWSAAKAAYQELEGTDGFDPGLLAQAEGGILNPGGHTPATAKEMLTGLQKEIGAEKYATLERLMGELRTILWEAVQEAVRVGSYNQQTFDDVVVPNKDTYVPFAVLDYFNGRVPAGIKQQIGTVKSVANPYMMSILKGMALNRLNERQKAVRAVVDVLVKDFPDATGPEKKIDKHNREQQAGPGKRNLSYLVDGKLRYREVDAYLAEVLDRADLGKLGRMTKGLATKTYGFFHPLYVSWSLGWQARNLPRDFKRTWDNLNAMHAGKPTYRQAINAFLDLAKLTKAYAKTAGAAYRHARRRGDEQIREMLKERALGRAFHSFEPQEADMTHERLLQRYGISRPKGKGPKVVKGIRRAGSLVETAGVFQETWAKAAAYKLLGEAGITGKERAYIVRNYTGTPDSTDRGLASDAANALYM
ncbi:hypothetical protein LCGC14_2419110, partial [marine sediment metagenome]